MNFISLEGDYRQRHFMVPKKKQTTTFRDASCHECEIKVDAPSHMTNPWVKESPIYALIDLIIREITK